MQLFYLLVTQVGLENRTSIYRKFVSLPEVIFDVPSGFYETALDLNNLSESLPELSLDDFDEVYDNPIEDILDDEPQNYCYFNIGYGKKGLWNRH